MQFPPYLTIIVILYSLLYRKVIGISSASENKIVLFFIPYSSPAAETKKHRPAFPQSGVLAHLFYVFCRAVDDARDLFRTVLEEEMIVSQLDKLAPGMAE